MGLAPTMVTVRKGRSAPPSSIEAITADTDAKTMPTTRHQPSGPSFYYPNISDAIPEFRFHPTRKWRFDFAYPAHKVAIEINGGVWKRGRHNRGTGYIKDLEKLNAAQILGWIVLQFTPQQMKSWETHFTIVEALATRSPGAAS